MSSIQVVRPSDSLIAGSPAAYEQAQAIEDKLEYRLRATYDASLRTASHVLATSQNKYADVLEYAKGWRKDISITLQDGLIEFFRAAEGCSGRVFDWALWRTGTAFVCSEVPDSLRWVYAGTDIKEDEFRGDHAQLSVRGIERVEFNLRFLDKETLRAYCDRWLKQVCDGGPKGLAHGRLWLAPGWAHHSDDVPKQKADLPQSKTEEKHRKYAATVAQVHKELAVIKSQMEIPDEDYQLLRKTYPNYLVFRICEEHPPVRGKVKAIRETTKQKTLALAKSIAALYHGAQASSIDTWWNKYKPAEYMSAKRGKKPGGGQKTLGDGRATREETDQLLMLIAAEVRTGIDDAISYVSGFASPRP